MRRKICVVLLLAIVLSSRPVFAAPHFTELPGIFDMFLPPFPIADDEPSFEDWFEALQLEPEPSTVDWYGLFDTIPVPALTARPADVTGHWAEQAVLHGVARGMIVVHPDNTVRPNHPITRGEFAFALDRWVTVNYALLQALGFTYDDGLAVVGVPELHPFRGSIESLARLGLIGGNVDFMPDEHVQRQEISRIWLNLFMRLQNSNFNAAYFRNLNVEGILDRYDDQEQIAGWARDAVAVMTERGFVGGAGGSFRPVDAITRAEAHTIFYSVETAIPSFVLVMPEY